MNAITLTHLEREFLMTLRRGEKVRGSERPEDRARQRMRKLGFAKVVMNPRRWVITQDGIQALSEGGEA